MLLVFQPTFVVEDFVNIGRFQMYLKLMIDGVTSGAFSAKGMGPWPDPVTNYVTEIIKSSRELYTHPRKEVEDHILKWTLGGATSGSGNNTPNTSPREVVQQSKAREHTVPLTQPQHRERTQQHTQEVHMQRHQPQKPQKDHSAHVTTQHKTQQQPSTPRTHNPFASALQEALKDIKHEVKTENKTSPQLEKKADTKNIDPDVLKDVLGL
jgi:hypothetical protein